MKKRLVLLTVILTLLVGFNQKTVSGDDSKFKPVNNYMTIMNAGFVCNCADFSISIGGPGVTVTIYNIYDNPVTSFSVPYAGIYEGWLDGEPAGSYYAVLTGSGIYEVDYFTKVCN